VLLCGAEFQAKFTAETRVDAAGQRMSDTQTASGLKKFLADNVSELRGMENTKYNDGGINGAQDFTFIVFDTSGYAATD
jgi:hypothetical protein